MLNSEASRAIVTCADNSFSAWYETNASYHTRIAEIIEARHLLLDELDRIMKDIEELNKQIYELRIALNEKMPLLKVLVQNYVNAALYLICYLLDLLLWLVVSELQLVRFE